MALSPLQKKMLEEVVEKTDTGTPIRYFSLDRVYSTSIPCSGSSNVMSKKVKARKLIDDDVVEDSSTEKKQISSPVLRVYTRRNKKPRCVVNCKPEFFDSDSQLESNCDDLKVNRAHELENGVESGEISTISPTKMRSSGNTELGRLGIDSSFSNVLTSSRKRERRVLSTNVLITKTRKRKSSNDCQDIALINGSSPASASDLTKKWIELSYEDFKPNIFVGMKCKASTLSTYFNQLDHACQLVWFSLEIKSIELQVYWPLDDDWYSGCVASFDSESGKHHVKYDDGEEESLVFTKEKIKFHISREEMQRQNLKQSVPKKDDAGLNNDELLVLAAIFDDCGDIGSGDIIWAKLSGFAMWPAVVVKESDVRVRKGFKPNSGERSVPVQFFGTHDFAWISMKQIISFLRGLHLSYHMKCKQTRFRRSLEEAKVYLSEQKLPNKMLRLQNGIEVDDCESVSGEDDENGSDNNLMGDERTERTSDFMKTLPFETEDLRIISLGKIVTDSEYFHDERYIWPEGYAAERKFISTTDPSIKVCYKMEVLRDPDSKFRPLFKVTMDNVEQFKGSTPSACWNKIYRRIRKSRGVNSDGFSAGGGLERIHKSGPHMFGFSNPKVSKIIKDLSISKMSSVYSGRKLAHKRYQDLPLGYRPVRVGWTDLDKCNVCHMDEEYTDNVFLQCDKCRMTVHARCYGELEPVGGVLWLCNLCRRDAPEYPPPCCLCPVIGGAMKPTTDGRWAHLACAIWVLRMEPIDGLSRINKDRWKLLCSICGVAYGACIQCSKSTCRIAYHPLCARAAGLCVELEDEDKLHLMSFDEDEEDQCIRLFSYCKKHRQPSNERSPSDDQLRPVFRHCSKYIPPSNPSGCARTEPYDFLGRRGRKEPEDLAAASLKRLYVENKPYLITGYCQNGAAQSSSPSNGTMLSRISSSFQSTKMSQLDTSNSVLSMAEKYSYMRETIRMRLAFGKSGIHGFGVFAKHSHKAGDMVIEYTGELVRPSIADRREHFIYNSLVGAGTYMFRIDDERVIDATRAGSIAHLINHSCEPNCYSRSVSIHGEEHVIIFAKRDIIISEELTYDYRFFSIGEQLACYCGSLKCRGVVNDIDAEEQVAKIWVPRSELIDWKED
ncbi:hypothetical protein AQUCO_05800150v1 [Aquilegia coerulea]|uniref:Histone-lysine N-methyltransferase n=1 Tax=Aquilegia coerulea TaxID=218851 RepID=A0A2G5CEZ2_AQUCA|nr:hypothetical protein AQUCO_05800150v1 [Aquilegia coerulea]